MKARIPENESSRLASLYRYEILDTEVERAFDELTSLAAQICGTAIAFISFVDSDRQWFKSCVGLDVKQLPRDSSFCAHAILYDEPLIVSDALLDARFAGNDLVTGEPHIRFYAGAQLITPDGYKLGTLAAMSGEPHHLSTEQAKALQILANQVVQQLELRRLQSVANNANDAIMISERLRAEEELQKSHREISTLFESITDAFFALDREWHITFLNSEAEKALGWKRSAVIGRNIREAFPETINSAFYTHYHKAMNERIRVDFEEFYRPSGAWFAVRAYPSESGLSVYLQDITECKQIEAKIKESEEYHNLFQLANDPILIFDPDGEIVLDVNDKACEIYGFRHDEFVGKSIKDITLDADRGENELRRLLALGSLQGFESVQFRADGSPLYLQINSSVIDFRGRRAVLSINRDLTEHKRTEEQQRESTQRFRSAFDNASIGMALVAPDGRWLEVNQALRGILGYTESELLSSDLQSVAHPDDLKRSLELLQQTLAGEISTFQSEKRFLNKQGHIVWTMLSVSLVRSFQGEPLYFILQIQDVTERKRAENDLRESEEHFRLLVEGAKDYALFMLDAEGRVESWNAGAERLKGYATEEIIGQHFSRFYPAEEVASDMPQMELNIAASKGQYEEEGWRIRKNGSRFLANIVIAALRDENKALYGFSVLTRDVTDSKQLEDQLRQSQKMEAIGQLAGGVAHDFNNLLTTILLNTQLGLARLKPEEPLHRRLKEIEKSSERAASLTRQLLAFSRRQTLERKSINLDVTIADIMKMVRRIIGEDIEVSVQTSTNLPTVFADPTQVEQVVMNLALNARDAMPDGGKLVISTQRTTLKEEYLRTHAYARPGEYVLVTVTDTGTGIDAETSRRIFEPFFTTKEIGSGTGLGLAMVYGIVKQHNGLIEVKGEVGVGTTFEIFLPVEDMPVAPETEVATSSIKGGTETILIVEDENELRELAGDVLENLGYKVLLAQDGVEGVERFASYKGKIDLVILDVVMPRMGGREACERIRAISPAVSVMFMTGYSAEMAHTRFIEDTRSALLQKPYSVEALGTKVRDVLDEAR